jgi:peptidoglycan-associated lipoprotein
MVTTLSTRVVCLLVCLSLPGLLADCSGKKITTSVQDQSMTPAQPKKVAVEQKAAPMPPPPVSEPAPEAVPQGKREPLYSVQTEAPTPPVERIPSPEEPAPPSEPSPAPLVEPPPVTAIEPPPPIALAPVPSEPPAEKAPEPAPESSAASPPEEAVTEPPVAAVTPPATEFAPSSEPSQGPPSSETASPQESVPGESGAPPVVARKTEPEVPSVVMPPIELGDVYFDFDRSTIRSDAKSVLEANAQVLKAQGNLEVLIEGHCDERGTLAYNMVLGERRAQAVKRYLEELGVQGSRMEIVSYGKERPICHQHQDDCWQKNRRAHLVVKQQ